MAAATPSSRRRHVDLLRAVAIVMVVVGHWLLMDVVRTPAGLTGESALGYLSDVQWLTWIFQVMPVFFLVGGVSNAISWSKHRQRAVQAGDSTGSVANWLLGRSGRVFTPLTLLLVLMAVSALTARQIGVNDYDVAQAVSVVVLPLWFLVVYLAVVLLTPAMFRLHERFGLWVVLACVVGVAIGDVLRFSTGIEYTAGANFAFAWLGVHQVGFSWFDGRLRLSSQRAGALAAGGLATALLLVGPGPYPVSMVSVPGAEIQNSGPPSLALVALATAQIGLAVLVSGPAERWLARSRRAWSAVIGVNAVIMTLYLWHMVAGFFGAVFLDAFGWLPVVSVRGYPPAEAWVGTWERSPVPGTAEWWWGRIPWVGTLILVMAVVVFTVGWAERRGLTKKIRSGPTTSASPLAPNPPVDPSSTTGKWLSLAVIAAYVAAIGGMYWQASAGRGPHGPFTTPTGALALVLGASVVLWALRRRKS